MGEIFGTRKRMSAIALLEANGVQDQLARVLTMAEEGRRKWAERHAVSAAGTRS